MSFKRFFSVLSIGLLLNIFHINMWLFAEERRRFGESLGWVDQYLVVADWKPTVTTST